MNNITMIGRATSDIELKQTQAGKSVASFSLAVKRPFTKDGTDFFTIVTWGKVAELVSSYVKKGNQIGLKGYITNRDWQDKQGNKRISTEVIAEEIYFLSSREGERGAQSAGGAYLPGTTAYIPNAYQNAAQSAFEELPDNDGLPF